MHEIPVPRSASCRPTSAPATVVVVTAILALTGCRTGSWTPPSTWSMFGSSSKATGGLTDAPEYAQGPAKPAATATPYPTTSTPESYVITDGGPASRAAGAASADAAPPATAASVGSVVYGSKPPASPSPETRSELAEARYASLPPRQAAESGSFAAQVGPYPSTTAAAPPAAGGDRFAAAVDALPGQTSPGQRTLPEALPGGIPGPADDPAARLVGAPRSAGGDVPNGPAAAGWSGPTAAAASPASFPDPAQDSRYATGGSRFSGFGGGSAPPPADRPQDAFPQQALPPLGTEAAPAMPSAPSALGPPGMAPPAMTPPASQSFGSPPSRRPDPGYRPGGTSSYQPRPGGAAGSTGVQTVGFDSPLPR
jgi:hypothetical protein